MVEDQLAARLQQASYIGDRLMELGERLKSSPWRWRLGEQTVAFADRDTTQRVESDIDKALDRTYLMWLLDEIRKLKRLQNKLFEEISA